MVTVDRRTDGVTDDNTPLVKFQRGVKNQKYPPDTIRNTFMPFWGLFVQKKCKNAIFYLQNGRHFPKYIVKDKVIFPDTVPLTPSNVPTMFRWDNRNSFGEKCNMLFFQLKMAAILWNLEQLGRNFALHSGTTQDMCLQHMIGITVILRMLHVDPGQKQMDPVTVAAASMLSNTYRSHSSF